MAPQRVSILLSISWPCSHGPTDVCALLRAKCATHPGPDGSLLVLQEVSVADDYCHGHCHADQGVLLMPLFGFGSAIWNELHENRLFRA
jgi:hypothetical protein